jgi:site-specific recombinase XerC
MIEPEDTLTAVPNRADALGAFGELANGQAGYKESRYAQAIRSLVERLMMRATSIQQVRGKRRLRERPQDRSNSVKTYVKALELFSYWSVTIYGRELDPAEVTTAVVGDYVSWLRADATRAIANASPEQQQRREEYVKTRLAVRRLMIRASGTDAIQVHDAALSAIETYGQANIHQIYEALPPRVRDRYVLPKQDARVPLDYSQLHRVLNTLLRAHRVIERSPSSRQIRSRKGYIWSTEERDPLIYRYLLARVTPLKETSVSTHLSALSAVWREMLKRTDQGPAPLVFNPWADALSQSSWRVRAQKTAERSQLVPSKALTKPIVRALFGAASGPALEQRRDKLALALLTWLGLRAEEVVGALRADLGTREGAMALTVYGKGNKARLVPVFAEIRQAFELLNDTLGSMTRETFVGEDGQRRPTYSARYAMALLEPDAPLVPSLVRWGTNVRTGDPEADARNPLDTSGLRALVCKLGDRARVRVVATGEIRALDTSERARVHPHAFRHYAATAASEGGVSMVKIKGLLGHESIRTTEGYVEVPAETSVEVSVAIYRATEGGEAMTADELSSARVRSSAIEQPEIEGVVVQPARVVGTAPAVSPLAGSARVDPGEKVASPGWAYVPGSEKTIAYIPRGMTAVAFSRHVQSQAQGARARAEKARETGDAKTYESALAEYVVWRSKYLYVTMRQGEKSKLAWWTGRAGRWQGLERAPIMGPSQLGPETDRDRIVTDGLKALYEAFWETRGPTSASALAVWVGEMVDTAAGVFARAMVERGDSWVAYDEPAAPVEPVVRMHRSEAILEWFERWGWSYRVTGEKGSERGGNVALAELESLPEWFWLEDPLLALPAAERRQLRLWIEQLQALRPSPGRLAEAVEQMVDIMRAYRKLGRAYEQRLEREGREELSPELKLMGDRLRGMEGAFAQQAFRLWPTLREPLSAAAIVMGPGLPFRDRLAKALRAQGIDMGNASQARLDPVLLPEDARAGTHVFDAARLRFDARDTIVHTAADKRAWFEQFGTDSECVARRAVRVLWERRQRLLRSQAHTLVSRHLDMWLASLIPCPAEIEERMKSKGWKPPASAEERLETSAAAWRALMAAIRRSLGQPDPEVSQQAEQGAVELFAPEVPEVQAIVAEGAEQPVAVSPERFEATGELPQEATAPAAAAAPEPAVVPQAAASALRASAQRDGDLIAIDARALFDTASGKVTWLVLTAGAAVLGWPADLLRKFGAGAGRVAKVALLDVGGARLIFRWPGDKGGFVLPAKVSAPPEGETVTLVDVTPAEERATPNPPWADPNQQAAQWPGYPGVDPADQGSALMDCIAWPEQREAEPTPIDRWRLACAMRTYSILKRAEAGALGGRVPSGWSRSPQAALPNAVPSVLPHPIDVAMAAARST